jgi:DNA repair protein RadC
MVYAGTVMQIKMLDHLIIGDNRYFSFAGAGMIQKCESDLQKFKMNESTL